MNDVDYLPQNTFKSLSLEEKLEPGAGYCYKPNLWYKKKLVLTCRVIQEQKGLTANFSLSEKTLYVVPVCFLRIRVGTEQASRTSSIFLRGLPNMKAARRHGKIGQTWLTLPKLTAHTQQPKENRYAPIHVITCV